MKTKIMNYLTPCQIKELNLSCFGCCGNNFSSKCEIEKDIELNSEELNEIGKKLNTQKLESFRDRFGKDNALSLNGLCYNLVDLGSGCFGCPLHPKVNELKPSNFEIENEVDLRINHCDINEECTLFKVWKTFSKEEKLKFIDWLKNNNYNSYSYSKENGNEKLYEKYLNSN